MAFTSKKQEANQAFKAFNTPSNTKVNEDSNVWLNIGVTTKVTHEDGTETEEFISLPINISLKTIQESNAYKYLTNGRKVLSPINQKKLNLIKSIEGKIERELVEDTLAVDTKLTVQLYKQLPIPIEDQIVVNPDEFDDLI